MGSDFANISGVAGKTQLGPARLVIDRDRSSGQFVKTIGQRKAIAEGAIGPELDWTSADGDARIRFGSAINDQLGINVEPKLPLARAWHFCAAGAGDRLKLDFGCHGNQLGAG